MRPQLSTTSSDLITSTRRSPLVFLVLVTSLKSLAWPGVRTYSVGDASSSHGNISNFTKTIREIQRKNEVLKRMEQQVVIPKRSMKFGVRQPWPGNMTSSSLSRHRPVLIIPRQPPVTMRSSTDMKSPTKNIIKPTKIERNILSFPMNPGVISGIGSPVSGLKLFIYVWKREAKQHGIRDTTGAAASSHRGPSNLVSTRDLAPQRSRRRNRRRDKSIKIRVFLSNKDGIKGKRIAEVKKKIVHSKFQPIKLPITQIQNILENPDYSSDLVHLRVECSRCSRKTRLVLPGNDKKRCRKQRKLRRQNKTEGNSDEKGKEDKADDKSNDKVKSKKKSRRRRRRRNCAKTRSLENTGKRPFILIDDNLMPSSSRFKRAVTPPVICPINSGQQPTQSQNSGRNSTFSSLASLNHNCCQKLETFINISDLSLEREIISPSGFHYAQCISECSRNNKHYHTLQKIDVIKNSLSHKINSFLSSSLSSSFKPNPSQIPTYTKGKISNILKRSRLKQEQHPGVRPLNNNRCSPSSKTDLTLLYVNEDGSLVQTIIPSFLVSNCQCNNS